MLMGVSDFLECLIGGLFLQPSSLKEFLETDGVDNAITTHLANGSFCVAFFRVCVAIYVLYLDAYLSS